MNRVVEAVRQLMTVVVGVDDTRTGGEVGHRNRREAAQRQRPRSCVVKPVLMTRISLLGTGRLAHGL